MASTSRKGNPSSSIHPQQQRIRIACRVRPSLQHELDRMLIAKEDDEIECGEEGTISCLSKGSRYKFSFDSVHSPDSKQVDVFNKDIVPMLDTVYSGMSCTVFSYGVTGSGKTHTMQGVASSSKESGIIPRTIKALFQKQARMKKVKIEVSMEYLEIYLDDCFDLLTEPPVGGKPRPKIAVLTNNEGKNIVHNLTRVVISSAQEFDEIYNNAASYRSTASTKLNAQSSRSHAVLSIEVKTEEVCEGGKILVGRINLVDLAGSENNKLTGNDKMRMAESSAINKSLTVLGNVIDAVNKGHARVPYRDSKLTRILQDTLGGSSVGLLICNISPGATFRQDTLNTLNFATRTKEVENRAVVNERASVAAPLVKPHFAALAKPVRQQAPVFRDNLGPPSRPTPVSSRPPPALSGTVRKAFGTVTSNQIEARVVPSTVGGGGGGMKKGKGKEILNEEGGVQLQIQKLVNQEVNRQLAVLAAEQDRKSEEEKNQRDRKLQMLLDQEEQRNARLTVVERESQQRRAKDEAMDHMNSARQFHDLAFKNGDRSSLYQALHLYSLAYDLLPGNTSLKKRVAELQLSYNDPSLPIPPRKSVAEAALPPPPSPPPLTSSQPVASTSNLKRSHKQSGLARLSSEPVDFNPVPVSRNDPPRPKKALSSSTKGKERARVPSVPEHNQQEEEEEEEAVLPVVKPKKTASAFKSRAPPKVSRKKKQQEESESDEEGEKWDEKDSGLGEEEVEVKTRKPRAAATRKKAVVVMEESDEEDDEDDLGGYEVDEEEEEWKPEPVEVGGRKGGRRG